MKLYAIQRTLSNGEHYYWNFKTGDVEPWNPQSTDQLLPIEPSFTSPLPDYEKVITFMLYELNEFYMVGPFSP